MDTLLDVDHFNNCSGVFVPDFNKKRLQICQSPDFSVLSTVFFIAANRTAVSESLNLPN